MLRENDLWPIGGPKLPQKARVDSIYESLMAPVLGSLGSLASAPLRPTSCEGIHQADLHFMAISEANCRHEKGSGMLSPAHAYRQWHAEDKRYISQLTYTQDFRSKVQGTEQEGWLNLSKEADA